MLIYYFIGLFALGLVNFYFSIQILRRVTQAEVKVGFFEIRWQVHKHMKQYCQLTRAESGRIGAACYGYWISLAGMLLLLLQIISVGVR